MAFVNKKSKVTTAATILFAVFSCVVTCILFVGSAKTTNTTKKVMFSVTRSVLRAETPEVVKYVILDNSGNVMSFQAVLNGLSDVSSGTADYLSTILTTHCEDSSRTAGEAYFWEVAPVSRSTLDKEFEFVMIPAKGLTGVSADHSPFDEHLSQAKSSSSSPHVITFKNLGGDATLIVPRPLPESSQYAHLADFLRTAPRHQANLLWERMADACKKQLAALPDDTTKVWMSTSGMGVYWLHVRLDSNPKYYNWKPYKNG